MIQLTAHCALNIYMIILAKQSVREQMEIFIQAAKARSEALDHVLIFGPPGLGKTTLANIIANEMRCEFKTNSGPVLERPGDVAALLTNLQARGCVIH